jgi:hypothetical protein
MYTKYEKGQFYAEYCLLLMHWQGVTLHLHSLALVRKPYTRYWKTARKSSLTQGILLLYDPSCSFFQTLCQRAWHVVTFSYLPPRVIPDWKRFLGVDVNKQALLAFLGEYTTRHYSELGDMPYPGDSLFIAGRPCSSCSLRRFYGLFFIVPVVDINNCTSFWKARLLHLSEMQCQITKGI